MQNKRGFSYNNGRSLVRRFFLAFVFVAMFASGIGGYHLLKLQPKILETPEIVDANTVPTAVLALLK